MAGVEGDAAEGVRFTGMLPRAEYRALLRRARVFVCAPRREDYGIAQLEALADGCVLVTTPSPGPYAALPVARALDDRLVSEHLFGAIRARARRPRARLRASARWRRSRRGGPRRSTASSPSSCSRGYSRSHDPAFRPVHPHHRRRPRHRRGGRAPAGRARRARLARRARRGRAAAGRRRLPGLGRVRRRRHRPGGARRRRGRDGRGVRRHRHRVRQRRHRRPRLRAHDGPGVVRARHRGQPDRRLAHDPRLPPAHHRAPRLRAAGRLDGGDPAAGRAGRLRRGEVRRRGARPRAAGGDAGLRRGRRGRLLLLDRHRDGPRRRPDRDRRGHARGAQGPARQDLPRQRRGRGRRPGHRAPQPHRRLPAPAADRADGDQAAAPVADGARDAGQDRRVRPARRARGRRQGLGPGGRGRRGRAGRSLSGPACAAARTPPTGACSPPAPASARRAARWRSRTAGGRSCAPSARRC